MPRCGRARARPCALALLCALLRDVFGEAADSAVERRAVDAALRARARASAPPRLAPRSMSSARQRMGGDAVERLAADAAVRARLAALCEAVRTASATGAPRRTAAVASALCRRLGLPAPHRQRVSGPLAWLFAAADVPEPGRRGPGIDMRGRLHAIAGGARAPPKRPAWAYDQERDRELSKPRLPFHPKAAGAGCLHRVPCPQVWDFANLGPARRL